MEQWFPKIPLAEWVDVFVNWLTVNLEVAFDGVTNVLQSIVDGMVLGFSFVPSYVFVILLTLLAWKVSNKGIALFTFIGLFLIANLGYWEPMLQTLALVLTAVIISIVLGIPLGIWASQKQTVKQVVTPILDFMQTMPAFVYLIPAIFFFNIGVWSQAS
ncbi:ABC-type proline/glycine betaine transport system permease subunit [Bacillus sp. SLBN-46]|nr:ABC-type proline/glycine betaine transport system permease subunit [Bacillus sp. SLBN-46]